MAKRFRDKVVWITGAGSGIGRAMAIELIKQGATVVVSGRRQDRLETVAREVEAIGGKAAVIPCDVTDERAVGSAVTAVISHFGRLDVAVANAGFGVTGRIENLTTDDWERQFRTNVFGVAATARAALPELRKTDGRLAIVGSVASYVCSAGTGPYSASKFAVRAIGETLSIELAGTGVTCTTIHPGFVESEIGQVDNAGHYHAERPDPRPQKLMWKAEDAARVMVDAIHKRKREYIFTTHGRLVAFAARLTPALVHGVLARQVFGKNRRHAERNIASQSA